MWPAGGRLVSACEDGRPLLAGLPFLFLGGSLGAGCEFAGGLLHFSATETLVPGATMIYANFLSGEEVARLVDYLMNVAHDPGPATTPAE